MALGFVAECSARSHPLSARSVKEMVDEHLGGSSRVSDAVVLDGEVGGICSYVCANSINPLFQIRCWLQWNIMWKGSPRSLKNHLHLHEIVVTWQIYICKQVDVPNIGSNSRKT